MELVMKGKTMTMFCVAAALAASAAGCGQEAIGNGAATIVRNTEASPCCVDGCTCTDCPCCGTLQASGSAVQQDEAANGQEQERETQEQSEETSEENSDSRQTETEEEESTQQEPDNGETLSEIEKLTEGELAARREQQANFAKARATLYGLENSKDKTAKINQMDRQILANNAYDFSKKNIVFIGDSITEGITAAVDINGNKISYVTYADSYLHFNRVLNHGMGGRMFSVYGDEELSLAMNFGNVTNVDSDIIVVFAGVNDYLSTPANKRFGNVDDKMSTAGYCGSVRYFMKQLQEYYSDREIFFVTMYDVPKTAQSSYSDINWQPTLNDYMEVQRKLAAEYGFHIIELYNSGFMDCTDKESADFYLRDGLHPKDNGNIALGEHIAAELSLYFGQNEE